MYCLEKIWCVILKDDAKSISYWKDILFQASGNTIAQLIGIAGLPLLTRLYAPESFADQAIFIQLTVLVVAFVTFRFEYFVPLLKNKTESEALIAWVVRLGFCMLIIFTLIVFSIDVMNEYYAIGLRISYYYYLVPVTAYLISLSFLYQHEVQRLGQYKLSGLAEVSSKLTYVGSGVLGSFFSTGLALIFTTAFGALGKILAVRQYILFKNPNEIESITRELLKLYRGRAIGMIVANTLLACSGLIPLYIIGSMYGSVTLGQFSLVMATIFLPSGLIGSAVGNVFYQRAGLLWNEQNIVGLKRLWGHTFVKLALIALPIYVGAFFIAPWAYPFVFGSSWVDAGTYASIMSLAAFFSFLAGPFDRLSLVLGFSYYLPLIHTLRLVMIGALSIIVVKFDYMVVEFIVGYVVAMSCVYSLDLVLCRFFLHLKTINI